MVGGVGPSTAICPKIWCAQCMQSYYDLLCCGSAHLTRRHFVGRACVRRLYLGRPRSWHFCTNASSQEPADTRRAVLRALLVLHTTSRTARSAGPEIVPHPRHTRSPWCHTMLVHSVLTHRAARTHTAIVKHIIRLQRIPRGESRCRCCARMPAAEVATAWSQHARPRRPRCLDNEPRFPRCRRRATT